MTSWLHEQRLEAAVGIVAGSGARRVLDLGCGEGDLLLRLLELPHVEHIVGLDQCRASLDHLALRITARESRPTARIDLVLGSMLEEARAFTGFDCALLIETIEHIDPAQLSILEQAVFGSARPATLVITTPNAEFNALLGVPEGRFRHPDHRFEWPRDKFGRWADGVAKRTGYEVSCCDIAGWHPALGGASQMAVFRRRGSPQWLGPGAHDRDK